MIIVLTTTATREDAEKIADFLLEKKLAACVQIFPISSKYLWKGKVERSGEFLCLVKTKDELYQPVEQAIREVHPYQTPEIVAIPVTKASQSYLDWLDKETVKE
ncbi:MAG: divalent-cation tolerance protein CutA [archaeon]|nr:MAG: divalent-cation tolerance protein CutA [archaeon]